MGLKRHSLDGPYTQGERHFAGEPLLLIWLLEALGSSGKSYALPTLFGPRYVIAYTIGDLIL